MFHRRAKRLFVKTGGSTFIMVRRESCSAPRMAMLPRDDGAAESYGASSLDPDP